jgi:hypothetical protein
MQPLKRWQVNEQVVRMVWVLISLALFVLGSGAPGGGSGVAGG